MATEKKEEKKITPKKTAKKTTTKSKSEVTMEDIPAELFEKMYSMMRDKLKAELEEEKANNEVETPTNLNSHNVQSKDGKFTKIMLANENIQNDLVEVESVTGSLNFISAKSGIPYEWDEVGDIELMTIAEIRAMENQSKRFLHTPWLLVHDRRVVEALKLEKIVDSITKLKDVDMLNEMSEEELKSALNILPNAPDFKRSFSNDVLGYILNGQITSIGTISILESVLGVSYKNFIK